MKTNDVFPSKYLKAEDELFQNGDVIVTIKDVTKEKMGQGNDEKPVMYFRELEKGMVTNKTNWATCEKMLGSVDSDDWLGERIALYVAEVDSFGDIVKAIRVRANKPKADKTALMKRYSELWEEARALKVEGVEDYTINPNMTESEITQLGKELRAKVDAAKSF